MSNRDEYMAHMRGFSDGAGIKPYKAPATFKYKYQVGYTAGKQAYRNESIAASNLYDYKPLVIYPMQEKATDEK